MIDTICKHEMLRIAKFYFSIHTFFQVGLLNHVNASLEECVERSIPSTYRSEAGQGR